MSCLHDLQITIKQVNSGPETMNWHHPVASVDLVELLRLENESRTSVNHGRGRSPTSSPIGQDSEGGGA